VFSVWSVPRLYTEFSRLTEIIESEWELSEQISDDSLADHSSVQCSELKKNLKLVCEDLTCELKALCVLKYNDIGNV
jgi:hypothetical protein